MCVPLGRKGLFRCGLLLLRIQMCPGFMLRLYSRKFMLQHLPTYLIKLVYPLCPVIILSRSRVVNPSGNRSCIRIMVNDNSLAALL